MKRAALIGAAVVAGTAAWGWWTLSIHPRRQHRRYHNR